MVWWSLVLRIYCLLRNVNSALGWFVLIFIVTVALFSESGLYWTLVSKLSVGLEHMGIS